MGASCPSNASALPGLVTPLVASPRRRWGGVGRRGEGRPCSLSAQQALTEWGFAQTPMRADVQVPALPGQLQGHRFPAQSCSTIEGKGASSSFDVGRTAPLSQGTVRGPILRLLHVLSENNRPLRFTAGRRTQTLRQPRAVPSGPSCRHQWGELPRLVA